MKKRRGFLLLAALLVLAGSGWWFSRGASPPASFRAGSGPPAPRAAPASAGADRPFVHPPGAPAVPGPGTGPGAPAGGPLEPLLVRDAVTKAPLAGARVFAHQPGSDCAVAADPRPDVPWEATPDPGCLFRRRPLGVTDSAGRLPVPPEDSLLLHVVAAGHRWGRPRIGEGGVVADLSPGSAVRLTVGRWGELEEPLVFAERGAVAEGVDPAAPAGRMSGSAEVEVESSHPVPAPEPGSDATLDEGVESGTWTYFVRRGARDGEIYARGVVTVAEGETAELRLDAVPMTAGPRVPVKVVGVIPKRWGTYVEDFDVEVAQDAFIADPGPRFTFKGLEPLNRHLEASGSCFRPDPDGLWRDTLKPDLPAGRYRVTVDPPGWVTEVEVSGPAPEVRIELPEPGEVRVTLLDAATGKPIPNGWGRWAPAWKGLEKGRMDTFDVIRTVPLYAPPGVCHADFGADGYLDAERDLPFVAGAAAEVKVALRPAAVLVVRLKVDGKPFEGGGWVEAVLDVDGDEVDRLSGETETGGVVTLQANGFEKGESRLAGLWAGPQRVTVTHIPGFEPVPSRRVEVRFGTVTEVEFDLVRAK